MLHPLCHGERAAPRHRARKSSAAESSVSAYLLEGEESDIRKRAQMLLDLDDEIAFAAAAEEPLPQRRGPPATVEEEDSGSGSESGSSGLVDQIKKLGKSWLAEGTKPERRELASSSQKKPARKFKLLQQERNNTKAADAPKDLLLQTALKKVADSSQSDPLRTLLTWRW